MSLPPVMSADMSKVYKSKADSTLTADEDQVNTFRSFFTTYNTLSELCFSQCVWDFGTAAVRNREDRCINSCAQKYIEMTQKMGKAFAEGQEQKMGMEQQ